MRVGIDVGPLAPPRTGVGAYTLELLRALLRAKEATYLGLSSGMTRPALDGLEGLAGHRHLPVPTRAMYKVWDWMGAPKADRLLGGVDVYHATNYYLPPTRSAKRVVTVYDLAFLREPKWCSPKIVGPFSKGIRRFCHEADAIIACSEATKHDIIELLSVPHDRVAVAYGAVDPGFRPMDGGVAAEKLRKEHGIEPPFLLFVGTLEPRKNVTGLLEAFAAVKDEFPHQLVLVGRTGWNAEGILNRIPELGIESRVKRVGFVPRHGDLAPFYSAADAFVFPSHYEGFGLPALEAMACGCPVITTDGSSLPEVCADAAQYVPPGDTRALAGTIRTVLLSEKLKQTLSDRGQAQARRFTWDACAQRTADVYRSLA